MTTPRPEQMAPPSEPGIYLRGHTYWIRYSHRGKEIRESVKKATGKNTLSEARTLLRKRLRTAGTSHFISPQADRLTIADLAELVVAFYRVQGYRSLPDVERHLTALCQAFDGYRARDLTSDVLTAYSSRRLGDGYSPATVNRELAVVSLMFRLAIEAKKLGADDRPKIPRLREANARQGFVDPSTFAALQAELPDWLADAATFAYVTGWRKGEVKGLTWASVFLTDDGGSITLPGTHSKTGEPRTVIVTGALLELLHRRHRFRRLDCPFVFHKDGQRLRDFRDPWHRACRAIGVPGLIFHDLRRSAVRNMVRAKVPEATAMAVSGHRSRDVFERYNIISESDLARAFAETDAYVAEAAKQAPTVVPLPTSGDRAARATQRSSRR